MKSRSIGLHIRYESSIVDVAKRAKELGVSAFQFFLGKKKDPYYFLNFTNEEIDEFNAICKTLDTNIVIHSSYYSDLASGGKYGREIFFKELELAERLNATHFVFHAGSERRYPGKEKGLGNIAKVLNSIDKYPNGMTFLLENTAFGNFCIGSDIEDFRLLLGLLNRPEKISFCIDSAHAYAYGYDVADVDDMKKFLSLVDSNVGLKKVCLVHLNNTNVDLGSMHDEHSFFEDGKIKQDALAVLLNHPSVNNVPVILELPVADDECERAEIEKARSLIWSNEK